MQKSIALYNQVISDIKKTKSKFYELIKTIDAKAEYNSLLTPETNTDLKHLSQIWDNEENANIAYYFKMKEHHSVINNELMFEKPNIEILSKMWREYIEMYMSFRCDLLELNDQIINSTYTK